MIDPVTEIPASPIYLIRGKRVMLDADLARIYGVPTARLNQQVNRNLRRFPEDFIFRLSAREFADLMLQFATSSSNYGGRRKLPYAFTEHGAIMLASVLNSPVAVRASVHVVRAFVRLRELLVGQKGLSRRLTQLERAFARHDEKVQRLCDAFEGLAGEARARPRIGFQPGAGDGK
ncbi:MAG: ORF6N domain-containing protein [Elusimicrobiota bacterium]